MTEQEFAIRAEALKSRLYRTARLYLDAGKSRSDFMQLWGMKHSFQGDKLMDAARKFSLVWCRHAVRRCAEENVQHIDEVKNFTVNGYSFAGELSAANEFVFLK